MRRENKFKAFLKRNHLPEKYFDYCKRVEQAYDGKDMDDIILNQRNISVLREKLKKTITTNDNSISQYVTGFNTYLKFAFSGAASPFPTPAPSFVNNAYRVVRAEGVDLTPEVEMVCRTLEEEYDDVICFAKQLLKQGSFISIPIIISDETPPLDVEGSEPGDTVLGRFFASKKPYIEIYYRNFNPRDAASIRNCLAHEYLHYLHYVWAGVEYSNANKELTEGLADFFGFIYSIHRNEKADCKMAKKRHSLWKKRLGNGWPYANALHFCRVGGEELKFVPDYDAYVSHGCIEKFVQVFFKTHCPNDAYEDMIYT